MKAVNILIQVKEKFEYIQKINYSTDFFMLFSSRTLILASLDNIIETLNKTSLENKEFYENIILKIKENIEDRKTIDTLVIESIEKINEYLNNNIDEVNKFNETKKQINLLTKKYKRKLKELTDKI